MAIGSSISPRGYAVDVTGRDYTLDVNPLIATQERAYQAQSENIRNTTAVIREGIKLGELIGARQQLGRVKAKIGELDVNDPLFAQKYSAIVMENPLAFTNESTAPVTRAAITPLLASAAQAQQDRATLQRAQVMAGQRLGQQAAGYGYRIGLEQWKQQNPRPPAPHRVTFGEELLRGSTTQPSQNTGSSPDYTGGDVPQLPTEGVPTTGEDLLTPFEPIPEGPAFESDGVIEGEGDGATGDTGQGLQFGNGILNSPTGQWDITSVSGDGVTARPIKRAAPPNPNTIPQGKRAIPEYNLLGEPEAYKLEDTPDLKQSQIKDRDAAREAIVNTDPEVVAALNNAAVEKAKVAGITDAFSRMSKDEQEAAAPDIAGSVVRATAQASAAEIQANIVKEKKRLELLALTDPTAAVALAQRNFVDAINNMPVYGPSKGGAEETKPNPQAQPQAKSITAQLEDADLQRVNQAWDSEKKYAIKEAKDLALRLGLSENSIIDAFKNDDKVGIQRILNTMKQRGVVSPLVDNVELPMPVGAVNPFTQRNPTAILPSWGTSKRVRQSYGDILRIAAKDPNYQTQSNSGKGWSWKQK